MNERVKKLSQEIRKLSPEEQADLMDELLVLSYGRPLPKCDKAWAEEVDRRIDAVERGGTKTVDARKALRKYGKPRLYGYCPKLSAKLMTHSRTKRPAAPASAAGS